MHLMASRITHSLPDQCSLDLDLQKLWDEFAGCYRRRNNKM